MNCGGHKACVLYEVYFSIRQKPVNNLSKGFFRPFLFTFVNSFGDVAVFDSKPTSTHRRMLQSSCQRLVSSRRAKHLSPSSEHAETFFIQLGVVFLNLLQHCFRKRECPTQHLPRWTQLKSKKEEVICRGCAHFGREGSLEHCWNDQGNSYC